MIEDGIQGGEKRYEHMQYMTSVYCKKDSQIRYFKKSWVPQWFFELFAEIDLLDVMDRKFGIVKETSNESSQSR